MMELIGVTPQALFGQLLLGVINGAFYAMLSLGLAVIFGMLQIVSFNHGALYMMGAFVALLSLRHLGIGYWYSLLLGPVVIGIFGLILERLVFRHLYKLDQIYGLLLTFGLALVIEGLFRNAYGVTGIPYATPVELSGGWNLGFFFLPKYRAWVVAVSILTCLAVWFLIERTRLGAYLRAAIENASLFQAFGIDVARLFTLTYGLGVALAAFAGVLAAPIYSVNPMMGSNIIIVVFAVVVIGGMGSIMGAIVSGFGVGIIEGLTKVFYPQASSTVIFVLMAVVLLLKPAGLFGELRRRCITCLSSSTNWLVVISMFHGAAPGRRENDAGRNGRCGWPAFAFAVATASGLCATAASSILVATDDVPT